MLDDVIGIDRLIGPQVKYIMRLIIRAIAQLIGFDAQHLQPLLLLDIPAHIVMQRPATVLIGFEDLEKPPIRARDEFGRGEGRAGGPRRRQ